MSERSSSVELEAYIISGRSVGVKIRGAIGDLSLPRESDGCHELTWRPLWILKNAGIDWQLSQSVARRKVILKTCPEAATHLTEPPRSCCWLAHSPTSNLQTHTWKLLQISRPLSVRMFACNHPREKWLLFIFQISFEYLLLTACNSETNRGGYSGKCASDFPSVEETVEGDDNDIKLKTHSPTFCYITSV